jgi:hypothetical protein
MQEKIGIAQKFPRFAKLSAAKQAAAKKASAQEKRSSLALLPRRLVRIGAVHGTDGARIATIAVRQHTMKRLVARAGEAHFFPVEHIQSLVGHLPVITLALRTAD